MCHRIHISLKFRENMGLRKFFTNSMPKNPLTPLTMLVYPQKSLYSAKEKAIIHASNSSEEYSLGVLKSWFGIARNSVSATTNFLNNPMMIKAKLLDTCSLSTDLLWESLGKKFLALSMGPAVNLGK